MISITSAELNALLAAFLWPLSRILALIASAPVLGNPSVPLQTKIGIALTITLAVAPTLGPLPQVDPGSEAGLLVLVQQVIIGVAMGFAMRVVFAAVEMAGELAGLQMGLGFATFFDPQNTGDIPIIGSFLSLLVTLAFLAIDGHLKMIALLSQSFTALPISTDGIAAPGLRTLAHWGGEIFLAGLLLALPLLAALLITNLALGILTRAAPQLNIFAVGFPLTLAIGLLALTLAMPYFAPLLERMIQDGLQMMPQIAERLRINPR
jgi:flagellar biosynthetic protein FliR